MFRVQREEANRLGCGQREELQAFEIVPDRTVAWLICFLITKESTEVTRLTIRCGNSSHKSYLQACKISRIRR